MYLISNYFGDFNFHMLIIYQKEAKKTRNEENKKIGFSKIDESIFSTPTLPPERKFLWVDAGTGQLTPAQRE